MFHFDRFFQLIGLVLLVTGLVVSTWGFIILGVKRSLCLNFFEENVPVVKSSIYRYLRNPEVNGFWAAMAGFALFTRSYYNLIIAVEYILLMIPHSKLENRPLND